MAGDRRATRSNRREGQRGEDRNDAHLRCGGRADNGLARRVLRGCIDHRDDRRHPAAPPCECDKSGAGTRAGPGAQILCCRARAVAPPETRKSVTNDQGRICSFFLAMTPMLLHSHSKCIAALHPFYVRCWAPCLRPTRDRDNLQPAPSRALRHNHRCRQKTESDSPRSLRPCRRQSEPEFGW